MYMYMMMKFSVVFLFSWIWFFFFTSIMYELKLLKQVIFYIHWSYYLVLNWAYCFKYDHVIFCVDRTISKFCELCILFYVEGLNGNRCNVLTLKTMIPSLYFSSKLVVIIPDLILMLFIAMLLSCFAYCLNSGTCFIWYTSCRSRPS